MSFCAKNFVLFILLQATFSEKGTKTTSQLHISKFEILSSSNKIHKNIYFSWTFLRKLRISNFEMWSWDVIFVPFSQNVTCSTTMIFAPIDPNVTSPSISIPIQIWLPEKYKWKSVNQKKHHPSFIWCVMWLMQLKQLFDLTKKGNVLQENWSLGYIK